MKFYMSYWSVGHYGKLNECVLDIHRLSVYLINKHYGEVHLITDSNSKNHFKELPFASISTDLDAVPIVKNNWALGKLYTYNLLSKLNIPFCHIDYDVFLWNPLPQELLNSEVFCQSREEKIYDLYALHLLKNVKNLHLIEEIPKRNKNNVSYNVGIFGGNNLDFIKKYSDLAIEFSLDTENQKYYNEINEVQSQAVPCISEQYYLHLCSQKFNQKINVLLEGSTTQIEQEACSKGYTHLMNHKNHPQIQQTIHLKLYQYGLKEIQHS